MSASDLRAQLLKSNKFRTRNVEVELPDGTKITVRVKQPSVEERNAIFAGTRVKNGEVDAGASAKVGALAIIHCVRDPDTDEPLFAPADLDSLLQTPANGWVDFLASKVLEVLAEAQETAKG